MPRDRVAARPIVKAYDVRGVFPDQLDERVARDVGAAFVRVVARSAADRRSSSATTCARASPARRAPSPTGATGQGADVVAGRPGLDRRCCTSPSGRWTCPARCSPRATTRRSTTASSCAAPAPRRSARTPGWPTIRELVERGRARPYDGAARHGRPSATCSPTTPPTCTAWSTCPAIRPLKRRRRRRQRHGRPHRPGRPGRPAARRSSRCTSSSTAPSPTTRPTRSTRRTCVDLQAAVREHGADIGLAFDGDADRCFVVDERGEPVTPVGDHRADRRARAGRASPGATIIHNLITSRAVPRSSREHGGDAGAHPGRALVHQAGDGRDRRRLRRRALRRTSTSATSGGPTPACSPRCTCWPRWADAGRHAAVEPARRRTTATSRPARSTRPSPTPPADGRGRGGVRRRRRRRRRSTTSTG